jgi:hypothetical protein
MLLIQHHASTQQMNQWQDIGFLHNVFEADYSPHTQYLLKSEMI